MLESITLKNLALIKESELTLGPGLNILTGETGAGKSIIIGSIRLALGEKASKDYIRRGADYALVELIFTCRREDIIARMKELDIPIEPDDSICIQRKITESRSQCRCNGETISSRALRELASMLIDIHGQNDTQTLLDARNYRDILDDYGDEELRRLRNESHNLFGEFKRLQNELEAAGLKDGGREKEVALAGFEISEIENARLVTGEDEELEDKYRIMKNGQRISELLGHAYEAVNDDSGALMLIGSALREIISASQLDDNLNELTDKVNTAEDIIKDALRDINQYMDRLDFSDEEYRRVTERLDVYNHLKNKYGSTVEAVLDYLEERKAFVAKMEDYDSYLASLEIKVLESKKKYLECASALSAARKKCADELEKKLIDNLSELNFLNVSVNVSVDSDEKYMSESGIDKVDFLVSFNPGEPLRSLSQVASGGELSRFMLALKAVTAGKEQEMTLVFDEIDSGISGNTAWNVSKKMALIGREHQVIAITHLPQIAAMADSHYLINKTASDSETVTDIVRISEEEATHEIARMVSGGELTDAGLTHAKELLDNAKSCKINL